MNVHNYTAISLFYDEKWTFHGADILGLNCIVALFDCIYDRRCASVIQTIYHTKA